jgi:undecaprenyl phosphate N,N'-diacetylbacillosamine 1-phosphate transferase
MYIKIIKPAMDFMIGIVLFLMTLPIVAVVFLILLFVNGGKPLFIQKRPGKNCRIFKIYKFKTMNDKKDDEGNFLPDSERLTMIGKFVRKTSIDELLQLINVIKGDMSLVGPRPLLIDYLPIYNEEQKKRHNVKPGITGLAQINGRNSISWKEKFELDVKYVESVSFLMDVKIIFQTISYVFVREGITKEGYATSDAFNGNN